MDAVGAYHRELLSRLRDILGGELVGVYAGGSFALGDYQPGSSDLDVAVVVRDRLDRATKEAIVDALRHESLPCPARGLELVVYSAEAAGAASAAADFELNLNTGARMDFRAELEPAGEWHWFAIDRAILRQRGIALTGPPPHQAFGEIPRRDLLDALAEGTRWHAESQPTGANTVLNACRTLRFVRTGEWTSKGAAGEWAIDQEIEPELVRRALGRDDAKLDRGAVRRLLATVDSALSETS